MSQFRDLIQLKMNTLHRPSPSKVTNFQPDEVSALTHHITFPSSAADVGNRGIFIISMLIKLEDFKTKQNKKWQKENAVSRLIHGRTFLVV